MICSKPVVKMCSSDVVLRSNRVSLLRNLIICVVVWVLASVRAQTGSPQITQQPANQYAFEGMTSRFSTIIVTGTPPVYVQWYKTQGPTPLPNQTNLTLTLTNVHMSDVGNYFVQVSNQVGVAVSSNAFLNVAGPLTPPIELVSFAGTWRFDESGSDLGTAWRATNYDDSAFDIGQSVFWTGPFRQLLPEPGNTTLELTFNGKRVNTYYF